MNSSFVYTTSLRAWLPEWLRLFEQSALNLHPIKILNCFLIIYFLYLVRSSQENIAYGRFGDQ